MKNKKSTVMQRSFFLLLLFLSCSQLWAQTPFSGSFSGFGPGASTAPTVTNLTITPFSLNGVSTNAGGGRYNTTGWDANGTSENAGKYIYFTITPAAGYTATISSVVLTTIQSSGTGPKFLQLKYVLSGGTATNIGGPFSFSATGSGVSGPTVSPAVTIPDGGNLQIRIHAYGGTGTGGTFSINAASISGTVETAGPAKPTIINPVATNITHNEARIGATVSNTGGAPVTSRGIVWGTTTDPAIGGSGVTQIVVSGTAGAFDSLVTGLPEGTLIYYRGFATNSSGTVYTVNSSFYTLSAQPDAVTDLTATAISNHDIRLNWTPSPNAHGYIVLQKLYVAPTSFPVDRTRYKESDIIDEAEVIDTILNPNINTGLYSNLISGTVYQYAVVPYRYNGTAVQTYNYNTDVVVPIAFDTTWGVGPSALSDIVGIPQSEAQTISSIVTGPLTTTNTGVKVWQFSLRDGGAALSDADAMPTIVSKMVVVKSPNNKVANWQNVLAYAALYDDTTGVKFADGVIYKDSLVFNAINWVANDNTQKTLTLRVSLKTTGIIDGDSFSFAVKKANIINSPLNISSQIPSLNIQTDSLKNVVDVAATKILITQQPPASTPINTILPSIKALLVDSNGNIDLSNVAPYTITSNTLLQYSRIKRPSLGELVFDSVSFASLASGTRLKIAGGGLDTAYTNPISVFASSQSFIKASSDFMYTDSIVYTNYQSAVITQSNSVAVAGFSLVDGGISANDGDNFGTTLTSLRFSVNGSAYIRSVALYQGSIKLAEQAVTSSDVLFDNIIVIANDNDSVSLTLRATFNSRYVNGQRIMFTIVGAVADTSSGSVFALSNAGGARSVNTGAGNILKYQPVFVTAPQVSDTKICAGSNTVLTSTKAIGTTLHWYSNLNNSTPIYSGDSLILNAVDESTSYFVAADSAGWLSSKVKIEVMVVKIPAPIVTPLVVCRGSNAVVMANSVHTINWYSSFMNPNSIYVGNSFNPGTINADSTFYVQADSAGCLSKKISTTIIVARVATPLVKDTTVCKAQVITLNALGSHPVKWFSNVSSSNSILNGSSLIIGALQKDTMFYVESDSSGCSSLRKTVHITVRNVPVPVLTMDSVSICNGNTILLTTANASAVSWYQSESAVNPLLVNDSFVTPSLTSSTTYYVAATEAGCLSDRKPVNVKVNAFPSVPLINGDSVCIGEKLELKAISGANINWYDAPIGGNKVGNQKNFTTPLMYVNSIYYVEAESNGCSNARVAVSVTVKNKPATPIVSGNLMSCAGKQLKIGAFSSLGNIKWYTSFTDTTSVGSDSLLVGPLVSDVFYYAAVEQNGCASQRATVNIKVKATPDAVFTVNEAEQCLKFNQFVFMNATNPQGTQYAWDFGDSSVFGFMNPIKTFSKKGMYNVKVKATINGCVSEHTKQVTVNAPDVDFTYSIDGNLVSFTPTTAGITSYKWHFTTTDSSSIQQAQHTFALKGIYAVTLTVTAEKGCSSSIVKNITIAKTTGLVNPFSSAYKLEVYPNPFKNNVEVTYETTEIADVKIGLYSITGSLIQDIYIGTQKSGMQQLHVDLSERTLGMYLLKIEINNQVKTIKLVAE